MEDQEKKQEQEKQKKFGIGKEQWKTLWEFAKVFIIAVLIVLPIRYFLFQPFIVRGDSMVPSFQSGDYLIIDELSYKFSEPQRGDVVVFRYPKDPSQRFIKRVIGVPGETVDITNGKVTIYSQNETINLDEKYLPENLKTYGDVKTVVGENEYFVMGDNREFSYDSRAWGTISKSDIIGKVFLRLFPVAAISKFTAPTY